MARTKIGLTAFGSNVRGISEEEMAHSNAAIIEANLFRLLIEKYDAEFYIIKGCNGNTEHLIKSNPDHPYFSRFKLCKTKEDYPEKLDLMYVQMGSENMRFSTSFLNYKLTNVMSYFASIEKYIDVPLLYIQTDFACPLLTPESYGRYPIVTSIYPMQRMFKKRETNILLFGSAINKNIKNSERHVKVDFSYCDERFSKLHYCEPDFQSIINIDKVTNQVFEVVEEPLGVAFAGKNRIKGSRDWYIRETFFNNDIDCYIMGNWNNNPDYVAQAETNEHFKISDKYIDHPTLLQEYNKYGFTFYVTCPEYQDMSTVTSRFYDSLTAKALPLIHYKDRDTCARIFGADLIDDLVITKDTIYDVMNNFKSKESRLTRINKLIEKYRENHEKVKESFLKLVDGILTRNHELMPIKERTLDDLLDIYYEGMKKRQLNKQRCRLKDDEVQDLANWFIPYQSTERISFERFVEVAKLDPWQFKIAMGFTGEFPDKTTLDDVPEEALRKMYYVIYI